MNFYERLNKLCVDRGVSPHGLCKELGIARSAPSSWKRGINPSNKTVKLIADYFGVSIDSLMVQNIKATTIGYPKKLTILRSRMGWTQEELSANLGITQEVALAIENGDSKPSSIVMTRINVLLEECADVTAVFGVADPKDLDDDYRFPPKPTQPSGPCATPPIPVEVDAMLAAKNSEIANLKERIVELKHTIEIQQELIGKLKNGKQPARVVGIANVHKSKSLVGR